MKTKTKKEYIYSNEGLQYRKIIKDIIKIAIPISLQTTLISGLQLIDNLFLGHLNNATYVASGVNAVNNITFICMSIINGFIGSIGIYFINSSARNNKIQQHDIFKLKVFWTLFLCLLLLLPTGIFIKNMSSLWVANNNSQAINFANEYGKIIVPSLFISALTILLSDTFKQTKAIKITIVVSTLAFILNSVLNYVLMYKAGMGIKGAAVATLVSRFFELLIWVFVLIRMKPLFIPRFKEWFVWDFKKIFKIFPKCAMWTINTFLLSLAFTIKILLLSRISIESVFPFWGYVW